MEADTKDVDFRIAVIEEAVQLKHAGEPTFLEKVCAKHEISLPTLYLWIRRVRGLPRSEWASALQVRYKGSREYSHADITPEAWEYFLDQYRRCASCKAAHKACVERSNREGWKVPSARALQRKLERENLVLPSRRRCLVGFDI
jgi:hypothetical protein